MLAESAGTDDYFPQRSLQPRVPTANLTLFDISSYFVGSVWASVEGLRFNRMMLYWVWSTA